MRALLLLLLVLLAGPVKAADPVLAPSGTLRAGYIVTNVAQARLDTATGNVSGVIADIARELARRADVPVMIMPLPTAAAVVEAVRSGVADIGFVAPNPQRTGLVLYSQTYMLVQQSALVRADSPLRLVNELDRPGQVNWHQHRRQRWGLVATAFDRRSSTRHPRLHAARCRPVAQKRRGDSFCWWQATARQRHARCFRATNARRQLLRGATGCRHTARSPGPPSVDQRCTR